MSRHLPDREVLVGVAAIAAVLFFTQADLSGFPTGHHGWITSHTLANAAHTTPGNLLTGYTLRHAATDSTPEAPVYFNRSPFVGTLIMGVVMRFGGDLAGQVLVSRGLSNLVIVFAALLGVLILLDFGLSVPGAFAAVLLALSGHWIMRYRDMVCVDAWTMLGFLLIARGAQLHVHGGKSVDIYRRVAAATSVGWGYANLPVLALWAATTAAVKLLREKAPAAELKNQPAIVAFALAAAMSVAYLGHNVIAESVIRDVSITETGVVDSAIRRLGGDSGYNKTNNATWKEYAKTQSRRSARGALPRSAWDALGNIDKKAGWLVLLILSAMALIFALTRRKDLKGPALLLVLSGPAWLILMRNLALFHDYTTMVLFGLYLCAFAVVFDMLPTAFSWIGLVLAASLFVSANLDYNAEKSRWATRHNPMTADFERIAAKLPPEVAVFYKEGYRGLSGEAPYKIGFYLPDHPVADDAKATPWVISRYRKDPGPGELLTASNKLAFLYKRSR